MPIILTILLIIACLYLYKIHDKISNNERDLKDVINCLKNQKESYIDTIKIAAEIAEIRLTLDQDKERVEKLKKIKK